MVNTHFARIENNVITNIVMTPGFSENVEEQEKIGIDFLREITGHNEWLCLGAHEGEGMIGGTYDPSLDRFILPKPSASFILNSEFNWEPPIPRPEIQEGFICDWDEENRQWKIIEAEDN